MTIEGMAEYVTVQDAAIRSGFSETALRNRVRAGQIPTIKPGPRCILLHRPTVDRLALFGGKVQA
jgi:hypothetical protein